MNVSQILKQRAEDLRLATPEAVAVEHLKQAGFTEADALTKVAQHIMEKEALSFLTMKGVDHEDAVKLVKAANINIGELTGFSTEKEEDPTVELLLKAAEYIEALELQIDEQKEELTKAASAIDQLEHPVAVDERLTKFASAAQFTREELAELQTLSPSVLTKMASAADEPWSMGSGSGYKRPVTDPLLEFLVG
jgi:methyl-accepting chemotaxis protein